MLKSLIVPFAALSLLLPVFCAGNEKVLAQTLCLNQAYASKEVPEGTEAAFCRGVENTGHALCLVEALKRGEIKAGHEREFCNDVRTTPRGICVAAALRSSRVDTGPGKELRLKKVYCADVKTEEQALCIATALKRNSLKEKDSVPPGQEKKECARLATVRVKTPLAECQARVNELTIHNEASNPASVSGGVEKLGNGLDAVGNALPVDDKAAVPAK